MTLDDMLARWAEQRRLSANEGAAVRHAILKAEADLDPDWLWGLLRPVTALLEGPRRLQETLGPGYLRLA